MFEIFVKSKESKHQLKLLRLPSFFFFSFFFFWASMQKKAILLFHIALVGKMIAHTLEVKSLPKKVSLQIFKSLRQYNLFIYF